MMVLACAWNIHLTSRPLRIMNPVENILLTTSYADNDSKSFQKIKDKQQCLEKAGFCEGFW